MDNEKKKEILKSLQVIVNSGKFHSDHKCGQQLESGIKCDKINKYLVFVGGTNMSNLISNSCEEHLHIAVDEALKYKKEQYDKIIKKYEISELKKAIQLVESNKLLVRKIKLQNLIK